MSKIFIRLTVAFVTFTLGLLLSSFLTQAYPDVRTLRVRIPPQPVVISSGADEAQILQIYREYGPAQTRHDREFFERIETEDFTLTVGNIKMSRAEDIRWMEEQPREFVYESNLDHLKVFDNLALAHGRLEIRSSNGVVRVWPFVDVWVKQNGMWRIKSTTTSQYQSAFISR